MCIMYQRFYTRNGSSSGSLLAVRGSTSHRWKRPLGILVIEQRRGQDQHFHSCAASTDFAAELQQCDSSDDWVKAVEIFAEVCKQVSAWGREISLLCNTPDTDNRLSRRSCRSQARALKEDLSPEAVEAGVRVFARHGQHKRSIELLRGAVGKAAVSVETLQAVFTSLLQANEPALAIDLLQVRANADHCIKTDRQPASSVLLGNHLKEDFLPSALIHIGISEVQVSCTP